MNYFIALICPPLSVWLSGARRQAILSIILFVLAVWALYTANIGVFMGGYAAGPVLYVLALIHAFVLTHRTYQRDTGTTHPHRGTKTQSKL